MLYNWAKLPPSLHFQPTITGFFSNCCLHHFHNSCCTFCRCQHTNVSVQFHHLPSLLAVPTAFSSTVVFVFASRHHHHWHATAMCNAVRRSCHRAKGRICGVEGNNNQSIQKCQKFKNAKNYCFFSFIGHKPDAVRCHRFCCPTR